MALSVGDVELTAWSVKDVVACGVELRVVMVSVDVFEATPLLKWTGFVLKATLAPDGKGVVTLSAASNAPEPVPRFTVIG